MILTTHRLSQSFRSGWQTSELHAAMAAGAWLVHLVESGQLAPLPGAVMLSAIVISYGAYRSLAKIVYLMRKSPVSTSPSLKAQS